MVYEMELLEFDNPLNRTYTHRPCASRAGCQTGFLFCLVDLPFRNPQSCSIGDHVTAVLGGNSIKFTAPHNFTYSFKFANIPSVTNATHHHFFFIRVNYTLCFVFLRVRLAWA
jgi:hypothetical protein